jgi:hypothetical protein
VDTANSIHGYYVHVLHHEDVPLVQVALHDVRRPNGSVVRVETGFPTCPPLPEEVPALVERDLNLPQTGVASLVETVLAALGLEEMVLLVDQTLDVVEHFPIVHRCLLGS